MPKVSKIELLGMVVTFAHNLLIIKDLQKRPI